VEATNQTSQSSAKPSPVFLSVRQSKVKSVARFGGLGNP
jgi:hypothetical protein